MISVYDLIVSTKQNFLDTKNSFFSTQPRRANIKLRSIQAHYLTAVAFIL